MPGADRASAGIPLVLRAGAGIAAVLLLPFAVGDFWAYQLGLLYLYAIAALGIGLCWGRAGFLPLGQGLFFGVAAYLSGLALIAFDGSLWLLVLVPLAAVASGVLAFLIGTLVFRQRGESGAVLLDDHARALAARLPGRQQLGVGDRRLQRAEGHPGPAGPGQLSPLPTKSPRSR